MKIFNVGTCLGRCGVGPLLLTIATLGLQTAGAAPQEHRGRLSASDYEFASAAASGGITEVTLGRIAAQKAMNPGVKQFGEMMVSDHGKAGEKLKDIATKNGATLPSQPTTKQQKEIDRLNALSGGEFDKEYVKLMVSDHKKDLKEFEQAAKKADNTELKAFAGDTAHVVDQHLQMVKSLEERIQNKRTH